MQGNQALGYGLLAGAAGITVLMLAWLAVAGVQAGGLVLGLFLLFVLAGPLAGAGWWVLSRRAGEARAEAAFVGKRRILDADRLFRRELSAELRQLARRPELPSGRLAEMAEDLERRTYDSPEWFDTVQLDDRDLVVLRRYDDLVWERTRWLRRQADQADRPEVERAVRDLEDALDQRRDLLVRGRRAPVAAPSALLRSREPARGQEAIAQLTLGDAVTYEDADYVAEGVATSFAEGRTWKLLHLAPTGPRASERWLYVGPEALAVALLEEVATPAAGGSFTFDGQELPLAESGTATVDVESTRGSARGVLVRYRLYREGQRLALAEEWPDGSRHTYQGSLIRPSDLEVWPAAREPR